jgi:hypothetical protein
MPLMIIRMDAEGMLDGTDPKDVIHLTNPITVGPLAGGMESGKASVAFAFILPCGKTVLAETSLELFLTAARAFAAKFPNRTEMSWNLQ